MKWKELKALLAGLSGATPLGRSEDDPKMLEVFSEGQLRIRNEWRLKLAKEKTEQDLTQVLEELKQAFVEMAK